MSSLTLTLSNRTATLATRSNADMTYLAYRHQYAQGDYFTVAVDHTPCYLIAQLDGSLSPALIYLTQPEWYFAIPFNTEREWPYPDNAFAGRNHYATVRYARIDEITASRNLAVNSHDQHDDSHAFPHASANAETRGEPVFYAKNAIDGIVANEAHGNYPFQSWGINMQDDAAFTLEFGRPVTLDALSLIFRADYPHDSYWTEVTVVFSDGTHIQLHPEKTAASQRFPFSPKTVTWLRLEHLVKAADASTFPALTQLEAYGHNA